jgi:ribosomal protein L16/L10AE
MHLCSIGIKKKNLKDFQKPIYTFTKTAIIKKTLQTRMGKGKGRAKVLGFYHA